MFDATELRLFVGWRIIVIYRYHVIVSSFLAMQILPKMCIRDRLLILLPGMNIRAPIPKRTNNQLLRIEEELGENGVYPGMDAFHVN